MQSPTRRPYACAVAVEAVVEGPAGRRRRECRNCGRPVTGWADTLRHADEVIRPTVLPAPGYEAAFHDAERVIRRALQDLPTGDVTDADIARVAAQAVLGRGLLRRTRARPPRVRRVTVPPPPLPIP